MGAQSPEVINGRARYLDSQVCELPTAPHSYFLESRWKMWREGHGLNIWRTTPSSIHALIYVHYGLVNIVTIFGCILCKSLNDLAEMQSGALQPIESYQWNHVLRFCTKSPNKRRRDTGVLGGQSWQHVWGTRWWKVFIRLWRCFLSTPFIMQIKLCNSAS